MLNFALVKQIIIAIDGFSSCGKSTLAKALSKAMNYAYADTGAMYRAVTLFFLENQVNLADEKAVKEALEQIEIHFERVEAENHTFLNGIDVEHKIREMHVANWVSPVAALPAVRRAMVVQQQQMGKRKGIVMDGRDIGTVVFPNAELKIFITADPNIRAERRRLELESKGQSVDFELVKQNLMSRDHIDSTRADSPLRQAPDALLLDNSHLTPTEQLDLALSWAKNAVATYRAALEKNVVFA